MCEYLSNHILFSPGIILFKCKTPGLLLSNMYLLNKEDPGFSITNENNPGL